MEQENSFQNSVLSHNINLVPEYVCIYETQAFNSFSIKKIFCTEIIPLFSRVTVICAIIIIFHYKCSLQERAGTGISRKEGLKF